MAESCALREWLLSHLTAAMAERGMTQVDMAKEAGISQKHLSQILTGKVTGSLELWDFLLLSVGVRHKVLTPAPQRSAGGAAGDDRATPAEAITYGINESKRAGSPTPPAEPWPACPGHHEVQHRDGKPPWCKACGWNPWPPCDLAATDQGHPC